MPFDAALTLFTALVDFDEGRASTESGWEREKQSTNRWAQISAMMPAMSVVNPPSASRITYS
jgi:hypothetical protein